MFTSQSAKTIDDVNLSRARLYKIISKVINLTAISAQFQ